MTIDRLTGLFVKKEFEVRLSHEVPRALRYRRPLTLLIVEVDFEHFEKERNLRATMSYTIFKQLGPIIHRQLRTVDYGGRISGDLFAALLPETGAEGAVVAGERLRKMVEDYEFLGEDLGTRVRVAINVGMASFPEHGLNVEELTSSAHRALAHARREGGNRAVLYPEKLYDADEVFRDLSPGRLLDTPASTPAVPGQDNAAGQ